VLVMGVRPQPILDVLNTSTERYIDRTLWAKDKDHSDRTKVVVDVRELPARTVVAEAQPPASPPGAIPAPPPLLQVQRPTGRVPTAVPPSQLPPGNPTLRPMLPGNQPRPMRLAPAPPNPGVHP